MSVSHAKIESENSINRAYFGSGVRAGRESVRPVVYSPAVPATKGDQYGQA